MAGLDVGAQCNNRCAICPREAGPVVDGLALLRAAGEGGGPITIHGGEPTLHAELDALIAAAARSGRAVTLETNGRAFAVAGRAEAARRAGLAHAAVTLLGATAASHDFLARTPGSFRQTAFGATRLRAAGIALGLRLVVTRSSLAELTAMASLALGLGAVAICFSWARMDEGGAGREWLVPRYALGRQKLIDAATVAARAGHPVTVEGVPLCLAPPHAQAVATGPACFAPVPVGDGFSPRCDDCAARPACPGVPAGYLARFGDGELLPR